jgi:hypothetical protein
MSHNQVELKRVEDRYDPERDLIPDTPRVTHTDYVIIQVLNELLERVDALEKYRGKPEAAEESALPFERIPPGDANHPAVQAYRDAYRNYPPKASYFEIGETIGDDPENVKAWHTHCVKCAKKGWNPRNVEAVLDTWRKESRDPYKEFLA